MEYLNRATTLTQQSRRSSPQQAKRALPGNIPLHKAASWHCTRGSERSCCFKCVDFTNDFSHTYLSPPPGLTGPRLLEGAWVSRCAICFCWTSCKCLLPCIQQGSSKQTNKSTNPKIPTTCGVKLGWRRQHCSNWIKHAAMAFVFCLFNSIPYFLIPSDALFHIIIFFSLNSMQMASDTMVCLHNFSILRCKSNTHSVGMVVWVLLFPWASDVQHDTLSCWAATTPVTLGHKGRQPTHLEPFCHHAIILLFTFSIVFDQSHEIFSNWW